MVDCDGSFCGGEVAEEAVVVTVAEAALCVCVWGGGPAGAAHP
jgi:hypothetical protein